MLQLNPLLRISFGKSTTCELPFEQRLLEIDDRVLAVMPLCQHACERSDLLARLESELGWPREISEAVVQSMVAADLLVPPGHQSARSAAAAHWARRGWLDALFLHLNTRDIEYTDDVTRGASPATAAEMDMSLPPLWADRSGTAAIALPQADGLSTELSFETVLLRRRTSAAWRESGISLQTLAQILEQSNRESVRIRQQVEELKKHDEMLASVHSGFVALETYCACNKVSAVERGLYYYDLRSHRLLLQDDSDFRDTLVKMCIGQKQVRDAGCVFIITAVWRRYMARYRHSRAYVNLMINVAELAQKYILAATAADLCTWLTPALDEQVATSFMKMSPFVEMPLYVVAVG